jgi:hypothetical protein
VAAPAIAAATIGLDASQTWNANTLPPVHRAGWPVLPINDRARNTGAVRRKT